MSYTLGRATPGSKLLARHEFDNASFPFVASHWTPLTSVSRTVSSGQLVITNNNYTGHICTIYNPLASRSKRFLYSVTRCINVAAGIRFGPAVHITDPAGASPDHVNVNYPTFASSRITWEWSAGAVSVLFSAAENLPVNTDVRVGLFVDGSALSRWESRGGLLQSGVLPNAVTGQSGIYHQNGSGSPQIAIRRWIECPDRFVTVSGLPTDAIVEVQNSAAVVLASATAVAGVATVDMISVAIHTATRLVVKLYGDTLATYVGTGSEIIEPGETYALVEEPVPVFIAPLANTTQPSPVEFQWEAFSFGTGNPVQYDLSYAVGNTWTSIVNGHSGTTRSWTPPDMLLGQPVRVRILARDTVTLAVTEYTYLTFTLEGIANYVDVVLGADAREYWRLEETSPNDFNSSVPGGTTATAYDYSLGGTGAIAQRAFDGAVCNGIRTHTPLVPVRHFFRIQGAVSPRFVDNYTVMQWVRPVRETAMTVPVGLGGLTGDDHFVLVAAHPVTGHVSPTGIGLGLQVGTNGMCVRQSSDGNLALASTYVGAIPAGEWSLVTMVVRRQGFRRWVELYLNGDYCDDLVGAYNEVIIDGVELGSWPYYGQSNLNIASPSYYGTTFEGGIDEVSWYDYPLTRDQIRAHYNAGVASSLVAPGDFTSPVGSVAVSDGAVLVEWGAVAGAGRYYLEIHDGVSYVPLAVTDVPSYLWDISGEEARTGVTLRVRALIENYSGLVLCGQEILTASIEFSILNEPEIWVPHPEPVPEDWTDDPPTPVTSWSPCPPTPVTDWEGCE